MTCIECPLCPTTDLGIKRSRVGLCSNRVSNPAELSDNNTNMKCMMTSLSLKRTIKQDGMPNPGFKENMLARWSGRAAWRRY